MIINPYKNRKKIINEEENINTSAVIAIATASKNSNYLTFSNDSIPKNTMPRYIFLNFIGEGANTTLNNDVSSNSFYIRDMSIDLTNSIPIVIASGFSYQSTSLIFPYVILMEKTSVLNYIIPSSTNAIQLYDMRIDNSDYTVKVKNLISTSQQGSDSYNFKYLFGTGLQDYQGTFIY